VFFAPTNLKKSLGGNMNKAKLSIKHAIEMMTRNHGELIDLYKEVNQPINIITDDQAEIIHALAHDTRCAGSGGSGWDQVDHGESKSTSHVQSRECKDCSVRVKVMFFLGECPECGSHNLKKNPRDGRWGINAKTHFEHREELKEYRLLLIEPVEDIPSCREFRIRYWALDKNSEHLNSYALGQRDSSNKSDHINFQPLKKDFYLSRPALRFDGVLKIGNGKSEMNFTFFDVNNETAITMPPEFANLKSEEVIAEKKFNKERGIVVRS